MANIQDFLPIYTENFAIDENNNQLITLLDQIRVEIDRLQAEIQELKEK